MFRNLALGGGFVLLCLVAYPLVVSLSRRFTKTAQDVWDDADPSNDTDVADDDTNAK